MSSPTNPLNNHLGPFFNKHQQVSAPGRSCFTTKAVWYKFNQRSLVPIRGLVENNGAWTTKKSTFRIRKSPKQSHQFGSKTNVGRDVHYSFFCGWWCSKTSKDFCVFSCFLRWSPRVPFTEKQGRVNPKDRDWWLERCKKMRIYQFCQLRYSWDPKNLRKTYQNLDVLHFIAGAEFLQKQQKTVS